MLEVRKTALLVEDDPGDAMLAQLVYEREPLSQLRVATDGEEAVACLAGTGRYGDRLAWPLPAYVLLDLKLPRKSGFEVLEWARAQPGLRRLPIVILSSSHQLADIERACALGANSYLVKPVGYEALKAMLVAADTYWARTDRLLA